jgi:hypothetical protein
MTSKWPAVALQVFVALIFMVTIFIATSGPLPAQNKRSHSSEQLRFSAEEDGVKNPVALPPDVMELLKKDGLVRSQLENGDTPGEKFSPSWFSASVVHLHNSRQKDLVVMAMASLVGGNVDTFWVFRGTPHGYELIMNAFVHDLWIKKTLWKGYREIELVSMSALQISSAICRFDGKKYVGYKSKLEDIQ